MTNPFDISNVPSPPPVEIAGSDNPSIARRLIQDLAHSLSVFDDDTDTLRIDKISAAVEMVRDLQPKDALEAQMIAAYRYA